MASKLSFNLDHYSSDIVNQVNSVKPNTIKMINDLNFVLTRQLAQAIPYVVVRYTDIEDQLENATGDPKELAKRWANLVHARARELPSNCYFTGALYEPDTNDLGFINEVDYWSQVYAAELGFKCAIANFSVGTPNEAMWYKYEPAMQKANELGNILVVHEYGKRHIFETENYDEKTGEGWLAFRFVKIWRMYSYATKFPNLKIILGEFGLDAQTNKRGWKSLTDANDYVNQLIRADQELQKYPYLLGAQIYSWSSSGGDWADFNVHGDVANKICDHIKASSSVPDASTLPASVKVKYPVNLRSGPALNKTIVGGLNPGLKLEVVSEKGDFYEVRATGFVSKKHVK